MRADSIREGKEGKKRIFDSEDQMISPQRFWLNVTGSNEKCERRQPVELEGQRKKHIRVDGVHEDRSFLL